MEFRAYKEGKLFCYLNVSSPPLVEASPSFAFPDDSRSIAGNSGTRLKHYLQLSSDLVAGKNLWCIIRETPESTAQFSSYQAEHISWKYDVIANDTEGMGVDKGFVPAQGPYSPLHPDQSQGMLLFQLPDLFLLSDMPEDLLGDVNSHVTLFGFQSGVENSLAALSSRESPPQLKELLGEHDMFINITVGKEQGYYDTILVKAGYELQDRLG